MVLSYPCNLLYLVRQGLIVVATVNNREPKKKKEAKLPNPPTIC